MKQCNGVSAWQKYLIPLKQLVKLQTKIGSAAYMPMNFLMIRFSESSSRLFV